jgi:hypothetical protein
MNGKSFLSGLTLGAYGAKKVLETGKDVPLA